MSIFPIFPVKKNALDNFKLGNTTYENVNV